MLSRKDDDLTLSQLLHWYSLQFFEFIIIQLHCGSASESTEWRYIWPSSDSFTSISQISTSHHVSPQPIPGFLHIDRFMQTLIITSHNFPPKWDILTSSPFVTVADVLDAIHRGLHLRVRQIEYDGLPLHEARHVNATYSTPVSQVLEHNAREQEQHKGEKRVDPLVGENLFMRLSSAPHRPEILELNVRLPLSMSPWRSQQSGATLFELSTPAPSIPAMLPISVNPSALVSSSTLSILPVIEDKREQTGATSFELSVLVPSAILPMLPDIEDGCEQSGATSLSSARMFDQAYNLNISGGEFYNTAGSLTIDVRHNHDASTHSMSITHLWQCRQACNQIFLPINGGEQLNGQIQDSPSDNYISCDTTSRLNETEPTNKEDTGEQSQKDKPPCSTPDTSCSGGSDLQNQTVQDVVACSPTIRSTDNILDRTIQDILSSYPQPPIGDPRSFERILKALLFAFSPLSPMILAALLRLDDTQHVERILTPAYPLIFMPKLDDNQTPVQFIDLSIVDFFLDRARSGKYFVDSPLAHRVLLDGCNLVMERVYREGLRLDRADCHLRDAYGYACQYWEAHRRACARSKL